MNSAIPIIEIDPSAGFCSGVNRAIRIAEESLEQSGQLHCLGNMVHNEAELERLKSLGMNFVNQNDIGPETEHVFIRAHGEPPETYRMLEENSNHVVDGTCPVVLRLQRKVKESSRIFHEKGSGKVVIYGKPGHPEIIGLLGQTYGNAILVKNIDEAHQLDFSLPMAIFAQTTANEDEYNLLCRFISEQSFLKTGSHGNVEIFQSICRQMSQRAPALREFAKNHDIVIFVSGSESSNGKYLAGISKKINSRTYVVKDSTEIGDWFQHTDRIGISGATSTPLWLMQSVADYIKSSFEQKQ
ncbi:MAG: 4-hydroxy-3-methylbut-2-enyl diphosphate reductase [Bacteroidetes bacterium HGW-Bacteroidetes-11]|jgi:4-hydroxy-3-methylbut-2-enyl diphosphate reductase|nr:MAG: 4-hydroxy-3-methylbut-2-enyl diphosphate reductase [Bacteroidetes bacterium HGW-Bacteroidetes-11]